MSRQTEAVGMIKIMGWWRTVIKRIESISHEEASFEPTDEFISEVMAELIDEIEPLLPDDDNQVTTSITFRHSSGKDITFSFRAEIDGRDVKSS